MTGPPGIRVWPFMMYRDAALGVMVRSPTVRVGSGLGEEVVTCMVLVPIIKVDAS